MKALRSGWYCVKTAGRWSVQWFGAAGPRRGLEVVGPSATHEGAAAKLAYLRDYHETGPVEPVKGRVAFSG